mgnify:CR=1 FL=1
MPSPEADRQQKQLLEHQPPPGDGQLLLAGGKMDLLIGVADAAQPVPPPDLVRQGVRQQGPAGDLEDGESACVEAMVAAPPTLNRIRAGLELVKLRAVDETGTLDITFFNPFSVRISSFSRLLALCSPMPLT